MHSTAKPLDEVDERERKLGEIVRVRLHMIGVDVGHDGDHRRQVQKRRIRFIGLGNEKIAGAEARTRPCGQQPAADDERRIETAFREHRCDQARRRRLAVRARDRDPLLQAHQLGQHQRARHDGNRALARHYHFGVVRRHRGRDDDRVGAFDIARVVANGDGDAERLEPARRCIRGKIGSGNAKALRRENLRDSAHACAADADKMHAFDLVLHERPPSSTQTSATRSAASRRPTLRAAFAMARACARVVDSSTAARRSDVNSRCAIR